MGSGPQKFWMVFNSSRTARGQLPKKRYGTLAEAASDAKALAEEHPGSKLYVLESIGYQMAESEGDVAGQVKEYAL